MKKINIIMSLLLLIGALAACSNNENENNLEEELPMLEVDFDVPESADPGEEVNLQAHVTYDGEPEEDAEVVFEIWKSGNEEDSEKLDGENEGNGDFSLEYTFEEEGTYEMYAHTDGQGMHTMPKEEITVGDGEASEHEAHHGDEEAFHTEGFDMHFDEPESVKADDETTLKTHITLHEEALQDLDVRYEIAKENDDEGTEWLDAKESSDGEYTGDYVFPEEGTYHITVHVEDDEDLHEHQQHEITVE